MEASEVDAGPQRNKTGPKSEAPRLHVQTWVERRPLVSSGRAVDGSAVAPSHLEGPMPPTCIQTMQAACSFAARRREKLYVSSLLGQVAPANFDRHLRQERIICLMTLVCRQPTLARFIPRR